MVIRDVVSDQPRRQVGQPPQRRIPRIQRHAGPVNRAEQRGRRGSVITATVTGFGFLPNTIVKLSRIGLPDIDRNVVGPCRSQWFLDDR